MLALSALLVPAPISSRSCSSPGASHGAHNTARCIASLLSIVFRQRSSLRYSLLTQLLGHANIRVARYDMSVGVGCLAVVLYRNGLSPRVSPHLYDRTPSGRHDEGV